MPVVLCFPDDAQSVDLGELETKINELREDLSEECERATTAEAKALTDAKAYADGLLNPIILNSASYGNDDLSTKSGVEGQIYFKVVE